MIEIGRKFPAPDTLDRIAAVLGIETYELFSGPVSPDTDLMWFRQSVLNDIERVAGEAVEKALRKNVRGKTPLFRSRSHNCTVELLGSVDSFNALGIVL